MNGPVGGMEYPMITFNGPRTELQDDGSYPEGTVHYLVEERLEEMAERARDFGKGNGKDSEDDEEDSTE